MYAYNVARSGFVTDKKQTLTIVDGSLRGVRFDPVLPVVIYTGIQALDSGGEESGGAHATAVVVAMVLLGVHIFMAALNPATNHALVGMMSGKVRRTWAAKHHNGWLKDQSG